MGDKHNKKLDSQNRTIYVTIISAIYSSIGIHHCHDVFLFILQLRFADADSNITSTMKSVRENVMAKSSVETTSVLSSPVSTDDSKTICKPITPIAISNKTLSVYGTIDLTNSTATLEPSMILPGSKYTTRPSNSSFSIALLNSEGKTLARYPFSPKAYTYFPQNKDKMALLSEAVPYISCTKQIMITKDGSEMASRYVSAHSPRGQSYTSHWRSNIRG